MTPTLIPAEYIHADAPRPAAPPPGRAGGGAFFSPIPRAVYGLREAGRLKARDVDVLGLLLDYKGCRRTTVDPSQETLAARLRCGPDTIQRSLARLAAAGLIVKTRLRDLAGRLGKCLYDLAPTLALMPSHAAKMRRGEWGATGEATESVPAPAMPQKCGVQESDSGAVAQADSSEPKAVPAARAVPPAVVHEVMSETAREMIGEGVHPDRAPVLCRQFGEGRCRAALDALATARAVKNRGGWLVRCLCRGWGTAPAAAPNLPPGVTMQEIRREMRRCGPGAVVAELERRYAAARDNGADAGTLGAMRETIRSLRGYAAAQAVH